MAITLQWIIFFSNRSLKFELAMHTLQRLISNSDRSLKIEFAMHTIDQNQQINFTIRFSGGTSIDGQPLSPVRIVNKTALLAIGKVEKAENQSAKNSIFYANSLLISVVTKIEAMNNDLLSCLVSQVGDLSLKAPYPTVYGYAR